MRDLGYGKVSRVNGAVSDVRVDWITATRRTIDGGGDWADLGAEILGASTAGGDDVRPSSWQGYAGSATKRVFVGWRPDSAVIRLSGPVSRDWWLHVATRASKTTRIDLAVTYQTGDTDADLALQGWDSCSSRRKTRGNQTEYTHIRSTAGGSTLYCGRRISEQFGRLYNKHVESGGRWPKGSWRYEVEYKGDTAIKVARALVAQGGAKAFVAGTVHRRFTKWEVEPAWPTTGLFVADTSSREPTNDETRMKWLSTQVASTVARLASTHHLEELQEALGLVESG